MPHRVSCRVVAGSIVHLAVTAVLLGLLVMMLTATAQPAGKVYRIGLLSPTSQGLGIEAFREGLKTLGYVEGHNIVIEHRSAEGNFDRLPELAAELVELKVDVIVAEVTQASLAERHRLGTRATGACPGRIEGHEVRWRGRAWTPPSALERTSIGPLLWPSTTHLR